MLIRRFAYQGILKIHNAALAIPTEENMTFLKISEDMTIGELYKSLETFNDVKIESLDGIRIGKTTTINELQGASFIITIGKNAYKIVQSHLETSIEQFSFLLNSYKFGPEIGHHMHKYLRKYEKIINSAEKFSKEEIAVALQDMIPQRNLKFGMSSQEVKEKIEKCYGELQEMKPGFDKLAKKANFNALLYMWGGLGVFVAQLLYIGSGTYYYASWDVMEAQAYLIGLGNTIVVYAAFASKKINLSQMSVYNSLYQRKLKKNALASNFDIERYFSLQDELKNLQKLITREENE